MKKNVFLLVCLCCVFTFPQCSDSDLIDGEIFNNNVVPVEPFNYSSVAFIARITENSGDWSLCTIDKLGNNMRKIVDMTVDCKKPVRSNSGTKLLFTAVNFDYWTDENYIFHSSSEYELYIVNTDGTGLTLIDRIDKTEHDFFRGVAWSPDDSQIVYVRSYDDSLDKTRLILYNISNNTRTVLQTEGSVCLPHFSPDGTKIAYCSSTETGHDIFIMDVYGNKNQLIISNGSAPKWSPRGDKIVYITSGKDRSSQISVANADGTGQKQLTTTVSPKWWDTGFPRGGNYDPQWTPDGKKIVYVSEENDSMEIMIINADGSKKTRLRKTLYKDTDPEVTPDGKYILHSSTHTEFMNDGIYVMKLDGNSRKEITKTGNYPVACK